MKVCKLVRLLTLSLVLVLFVTACGGPAASPAGSPAQETAKAEEKPAEAAENTEGATADDTKPAGGVQGWGEETLAINVAVMTGFTQADSELQKLLEERYNVKFTLTVLPGWADGQSKINLLMADDTQRPDVMWWWGMEKEFTQWRDAGLLVDVAPFYNKYPNIKGYYDRTVPDSPFYATEPDGKMYRVMGDVAEPTCMTLLVRQDWLDKVGGKVPTTIDEMADLMRKFTNEDPDGNGQSDTYGLHGAMEFRSLTPFFSAFKSIPDQFVRVGDQVLYGATQPETREALAYIAALYKEGLIDPDIMVKNNSYDEAFVNGGHGFTYRWLAYLNPQDTALLSFEASNPGGAWTQVDPISGPTGYQSDRPENPSAWCFYGITKNAADPERIYAIFDDITSPEIYLQDRYGIEGRDYTYEDGIYKMILTEEDNLSRNVGRGLFNNFVNRKDEWNITNVPEVVQAFQEGTKKAQPDRDYVYYFKEPDRPVWNAHKADIEALRDEYLWGIISGQRPIEDFDKFLELFKANGGAEIEAEATAYAVEQDASYQAFRGN